MKKFPWLKKSDIKAVERLMRSQEKLLSNLRDLSDSQYKFLYQRHEFNDFLNEPYADLVRCIGMLQSVEYSLSMFYAELDDCFSTFEGYPDTDYRVEKESGNSAESVA